MKSTLISCFRALKPLPAVKPLAKKASLSKIKDITDSVEIKAFSSRKQEVSLNLYKRADFKEITHTPTNKEQTKICSRESIRIWSRVPRGLEWIAAAEASLLGNVNRVETQERGVLFHCDDITTARQLKCIDDAFFIWRKVSGIGHTRSELDKLSKSLSLLPNSPIELRTTQKFKIVYND